MVQNTCPDRVELVLEAVSLQTRPLRHPHRRLRRRLLKAVEGLEEEVRFESGRILSVFVIIKRRDPETGLLLGEAELVEPAATRIVPGLILPVLRHLGLSRLISVVKF